MKPWLINLWAGITGIMVLILFLDVVLPPDLSKVKDVSVVVGGEGGVLRVFSSEDETFRLSATPEDVDPRYIEMLIAFEDQRFRSHWGVDALALGRAIWQLLSEGGVVSGASTLTMQTARLLEPRPRTIGSKLIEMARAFQLERRYSKEKILSLYLTLAPYGGTLEGVRAASLSYFGKEPKQLSDGEAALLVVLPQAPSRLRPDRYPERAEAARAKVLRRANLEGKRLEEALAERVPNLRRPLPFLSPHLARRLMQGEKTRTAFQTTIDPTLQASLETLAAREARSLEDRSSLAILVVENATRKIKAYVGSADFLAEEREGQVDMVNALRSPGSLLKPFIYGMAFDRGFLHPQTLLRDAPTRFGDYAPGNFDKRHMGEVTAEEALRLSRNVPAVAVLQKLGPTVLVERFRRGGVSMVFGNDNSPSGLALALGGLGMTLEDLASLYAALASDGVLRPLVKEEGTTAPDEPPVTLMRAPARWQVNRILGTAPRPETWVSPEALPRPGRIAFKTGTSYGFRDAWAIGFDKTHTVAVWTGRPDGTPSPGRYGIKTAAPILFGVFGHLPKSGPAAGPTPPPGTLNVSQAELPPALRSLEDNAVGRAAGVSEPPPQITFPADGSTMPLKEVAAGLPLEAEGGRRPLQWLVNGNPLPSNRWARRSTWVPDGPGFAEVTVIDALGRSAGVSVRMTETPNLP